MKRTAVRVVPAIALLALGVATFVPHLKGQNTGQPSTKNGEWPMYTADLNGSKYSPLDQIGASNFSKLEVAWRFKTDNLGPRPENKLEGTPIMVKGPVYATAGTPPATLQKISAAMAQVMKDPDTIRRLADVGAVAGTMDPAQFDAFSRSEYARYGKLIAELGVKLD